MARKPDNRNTKCFKTFNGNVVPINSATCIKGRQGLHKGESPPKNPTGPRKGKAKAKAPAKAKPKAKAPAKAKAPPPPKPKPPPPAPKPGKSKGYAKKVVKAKPPPPAPKPVKVAPKPPSPAKKPEARKPRSDPPASVVARLADAKARLAKARAEKAKAAGVGDPVGVPPAPVVRPAPGPMYAYDPFAGRGMGMGDAVGVANDAQRDAAYGDEERRIKPKKKSSSREPDPGPGKRMVGVRYQGVPRNADKWGEYRDLDSAGNPI